MVKSMKPNKQRKSQANAPSHTKRKRVRARLPLSTPDARLAGLRNITVRVGDSVRVVRGDGAYGGKRIGGPRNRKEATEGKVIRVDSEHGRLFIEGMTTTKADGAAEAFPVHASNVVITKIDEQDALRVKRLQERRN